MGSAARIYYCVIDGGWEKFGNNGSMRPRHIKIKCRPPSITTTTTTKTIAACPMAVEVRVGEIVVELFSILWRDKKRY